MFTEKLFDLEEFAEVSRLDVKRGCAFAYVGKVPTKLDPRLVACKESKHLIAAAQEAGVSGVIVPAELEAKVPKKLGFALSNDPVGALNEIQSQLSNPTSGQWKSSPSRIHPEATIMAGAYVAPEDVVIEKNVTIFPNAVILPRSIIGEGSTIGPGTIVGTDAFEVNLAAEPRRILPQSGGVLIGKNVDIQANCTIVRATFGGFTEIGDETKFDCQVHFAHDCRAGKRVRVAACAEISGRVAIGENTFVGPNASISNGVRVGRGAHVTIGAVVTRDVEDNTQVTGNFAVPHHKWLNFLRSIR
tara:strand:+ start:15195 stop:16100 length:906 start_codon:yes stop_codon:yes gene_type:complete